MDAEILRRLAALEARVEALAAIEIPGQAVTYTPTYGGETTAGVTTYGVQFGRYRYMAYRLIQVMGYITWTAATGTGNANISLPVAADATANNFAPLAIWTYDVTFGSGSPQATIITNTSFFRLYYPATNAPSTIIAVEAAGQVMWNGFYMSAS